MRPPPMLADGICFLSWVRLLLIDFFVDYFAPLYFIPDSLMEKIAKCSVDIAHNHKTQCYFYLAGKKIN